MTHTTARLTLGLVATAAALLALSGCTGSSAPAPTASGEAGAVSDADFSAARDAYDLKLAQCLRDRGLDVADPQPGQGITESSEEINAAAGECMAEIGDPPTSGTQMTEADYLKESAEWAECFRDLGYEADIPKPGDVFAAPEDATQQDIDTCLA